MIKTLLAQAQTGSEDGKAQLDKLVTGVLDALKADPPKKDDTMLQTFPPRCQAQRVENTAKRFSSLRRYLATLQHQFNTTVSNFEKFEARRLARKYDRDRDPAVEPPYHRPVFDALEADLERERELFYTDPEPESDQIPDVSELLAKLEKDANPVTPIDVWNRLMQTREHEFPNEPENPSQPPRLPANEPPL